MFTARYFLTGAHDIDFVVMIQGKLLAMDIVYSILLVLLHLRQHLSPLVTINVAFPCSIFDGKDLTALVCPW